MYVRTEKGVVFEVKCYMFSFQGHISCSQESCVSFTHSHPNPIIIFLYGVKKSAFICCLVGLFFVVIVQFLLHGKCSAAVTENLCSCFLVHRRPCFTFLNNGYLIILCKIRHDEGH